MARKQSRARLRLINEHMSIADAVVNKFAGGSRRIDEATREDWRQVAYESVIKDVDAYLEGSRAPTALPLDKVIYMHARAYVSAAYRAWLGHYSATPSLDDVVGYSDDVATEGRIHRARSCNPISDSVRGAYRELRPDMVDHIGDVQIMLFAMVCAGHPFREEYELERRVTRDLVSQISAGYKNMAERKLERVIEDEIKVTSQIEDELPPARLKRPPRDVKMTPLCDDSLLPALGKRRPSLDELDGAAA